MSTKAPAAKQSTDVVNYQAELAALTQSTLEAEKPSGNYVSFKNGQLAINGARMKDDKVEMVVLHSIFENQLYEGRYNPNQTASPICFAFGENDDDMAPHPASPQPQSKSCGECPKNAWKSDPDGGKGKACKNVRRIAMIAATDLTMVDKAEVAMAKLPVTSVKNWSTYANQVAQALKLPPIAVISEMSVVPDANTQLKVHFRFVSKIEKPEHVIALLKKRQQIHDLVYAPYEATPAGQTTDAAAPRKY